MAVVNAWPPRVPVIKHKTQRASFIAELDAKRVRSIKINEWVDVSRPEVFGVHGGRRGQLGANRWENRYSRHKSGEKDEKSH